MEIKNARIESTMLGKDHGVMTFDLLLKTEKCSVAFGGYVLDQYDKENRYRQISGIGLEAISKILDIVGVKKWEELPGEYIRFIDNGWGSSVDMIGNIIEDKWFNIREFFEGKLKESD